MLLSVVPAALLMFGLIGYNYQRDRAQLVSNTTNTARALASALDQRLAEVQTALSVLASTPLPVDGDYEHYYGRATAVARALQVSSIGLIDREGRQLFNTLRPLGQALPSFGPSPSVRTVFDTGKPLLVDLFTGPSSGRPNIAVAVPVLRDGQVAFIVAAGISPDRLRELLQRQHLPPGWIAGIVDRSGTIVARSHEHERFVGTRSRESLIERIRESNEGASEGMTVAGEQVLSVFSRAPRSQWAAIIGIPVAELTGDLRRQLLMTLLATSLLLATGLALAWARAGSIVRTIEALMQQAQALGRGDKPPPAAVDFREAEMLGQAFEQAARRLELANLQLGRRLEALLQSAMDAVLAVDAAHEVVVFNGAAAALFGYTPQEALGLPLDRLLPPPDEADTHWMTQLLDSGDGRRADEMDLHGVHRDGTVFPVEVSVSTVREAGTLYHTVFVRDVTEKRQARLELLRSNRDLQQFAFVASHDLRSPLRSIKGYLDLLQARHGPALEPKGQDLVRRASGAVNQLDMLTNDLLSFARLDARPEMEAGVDCHAVVTRCVQMLEADIAHKQAHVTLRSLPAVRADPRQLQQLWQNLLGNALTYSSSERSPVIVVDARRGTREWVFAVEDNGIGIEPKYREKIFEIFQRLHSQQEYPGSGVGLSICQRIVERHGGRIWVESATPHGSRFLFTIPDPQGAS
ncbi:MAG: PAS domain S-box protein [Comamonadaceae bacterium]|nr:MAG: PAS domain S-box protein [Comamonadaceae bacterium]